MTDPVTEPLTALLERARQHVMTPAEIFEQRLSWIYGEMLQAGRFVTKDDVRRMLAEQQGAPSPAWHPIDDARHDGTLYVVRGVADQGTRYDGERPYVAWWEPATEFQEASWVRFCERAPERPQAACVCWPDEFYCEVPT